MGRTNPSPTVVTERESSESKSSNIGFNVNVLTNPKIARDFLLRSMAQHFFTTLTYKLFQYESRSSTNDNVMQFMIGRLIEPYYPMSVERLRGIRIEGRQVKLYEIHGTNFIIPNKREKHGFILITINVKDTDGSDIIRDYAITFVGKNHELYASNFHRKYRAIIKEVFSKTNTRLEINRVSPHGGTNWVMGFPKRNPDSVFMDPVTKADLYKTLKRFEKRSTEEYYERIQEPYHFNILLHGSPGSGKNSLIYAIATLLDRPIILIPHSIFSQDEIGSSRPTLNELVGGISKCVLVIDEIDMLLPKREELDTGSAFIFNDILSFLDCVGDGNIVIICTNYIDRLDPALIRKGRINKRIKLDAWDESILDEALSYHGLRKADLKAYIPDIDTAKEYQPAEVMDAIREIKLNKFGFEHDLCKESDTEVKE